MTIARVAHAIWEAEGQPEGRDHEHWMRARQLIEGRAEIEFPQAAAPRRGPPCSAPGTAGFEDAAPGMVPRMKDEPGEELRKNPAVASRSSSPICRKGHRKTPPRRSRCPARGIRSSPATNAEGYVTVPSVNDVAGGPSATIHSRLLQNLNRPRRVKDPAAI